MLALLDLYDAATDLMRRWSRAVSLAHSGDAAAAFIASILIHDFRPVRGYAIRLAEQIKYLEQRAGAAGLLTPTSQAG
ncbi:hypothetical protein [Nocardia sp. NRRL S-836]|uniref:hypothetical protein n=1 Tax=Nocardia sp. NRRL S-836 TaxID=1519492 RepID=UPI0012FA5092|nr:hypothetical protein [Nocardia sp. NRRL S-836]